VLDQVAAATKVAAKKTAGVVADDMALNAQQVTGVEASRELSVVWAVAKGSLLNKLVIVPVLIAISAIAPWAVTALLLAGGLFLCFEGFEKVAHRIAHREDEEAQARAKLLADVADPAVDLVAVERDKIKGAIRTDFVLSAEIAVIALGAVASAPIAVRVATLSVVGVAMTVGVYGLVAGIVRFDDAGVWLASRAGEGAGRRAQRAAGRGILRAAPWLMRLLSVLGTTAMFLVGGSIVAHNVGPVHRATDALVAKLTLLGPNAARTLLEGLVGVLAGALSLVVVLALSRVRRVFRRA
jgi:predicted DNA repair protein MutK